MAARDAIVNRRQSDAFFSALAAAVFALVLTRDFAMGLIAGPFAWVALTMAVQARVLGQEKKKDGDRR